MKLCCGRLALSFLSLLVALCHCLAAQQPVAKSTTEQQQQKQQSDTKATAEPSNIVAKIGDYVITREELEQRLMSELRPYGYDQFSEKAEPVDAKEVLIRMIAEKAMVMEARKQGYLQDEEIAVPIERFKQGRLANLVLGRYLQGKAAELAVTDEEISKQIELNPKLSREQAMALLQKTKASTLLEQYYNQLCKKFHVQKLSVDFPKAAQIHQRLLQHPKKPRDVWWILRSQISDELTPEEKDIVLATYDGGKVTLRDWFNSLDDIAPPYRPRDLNTADGVERFLDRALRLPLFVAEAKALGLDKDAGFIKQVRQREDDSLLGKLLQEKVRNVVEPNEQQIVAYFEKNKEAFGTPRTLKIDQIWCQDLKTAQKVKVELENGKDFQLLKQEYSLQKQGSPFDTNAGNEGMFFKDLWKGDPNEIVGPVKGFYSEGIKWRIVKILEKKPAVLKEYSDKTTTITFTESGQTSQQTVTIKNQVKFRMMDEQSSAILAKYRKELLEKYSYEIYAERIKDINPLNIP